MPFQLRDGQNVFELAKGPRREWTTTRDFFLEKEFLDLRAGIRKLQSTRAGAEALAGFRAGEELSPDESKLLKDNLAGFDGSRAAVVAVADWIAKRGDALPEKILASEGRVVMPSDIRHAAEALAEILGDKAEAGVETMRRIAKGGEVPPLERREVVSAFTAAGLVSGTGDLNIDGRFLLSREGAGFLVAAEIPPGAEPGEAKKAVPAVAGLKAAAPKP